MKIAKWLGVENDAVCTGLLIFCPVVIFYRLNKINILGQPRAYRHFRHFTSS